jgi:NAD+ synthase (glutamine-hydrolysing)
MKIALVQINPTIGDFDANAGKILQHCEAARQLGCDLAVFPELAIPGYPPKDLLETPEFIDANLACLERVIGSIRGIGVICGYVDRNRTDTGKPLHNAAVLFEDGRVLHRVYKQLLPTYDVFDERRYFEPGDGNATILYKGSRIGLTICEDAWNDEDIFARRIYDKDPVERLAKEGADLFINISASVFHMGKQAFRGHMLGAIAKKYSTPMVYVNQVGGNDGLLFDGISTTFESQGKIAVQATDFEEDLVVFDTDAPEKAQPADQVHPVSPSDVASVAKALATGTHDYVTKCGFQKVVVGLSGGIDSALTAAIAVKALGPENVSVVFMPSQYTSRENYEDTRQLADNLSIELTTIPIDSVFREFIQHLSPDFDPAAPGITEQNIQARIRGTILMAHSNRQGSLVLSTGNKSELAVGYCTLYGDMTGGLAVISDVPKALVYDISRFYNMEKVTIPLRIIEKAPSAELKPDQTDQDDLPPYEVLDPILKAYIEDLKRVDDIVALGFDRDTVLEVINRVDRNEYKRQQAAPGLKVTSKAFGYGRRYPLAQRFRRV